MPLAVGRPPIFVRSPLFPDAAHEFWVYRSVVVLNMRWALYIEGLFRESGVFHPYFTCS